MARKKTERSEEIRDLRFNKQWKLQDIADKYGITRQRVHQILGNTGRKKPDYYKELINYKDYTNKEISEVFGITEKTVAKITNHLNIRNKVDNNYNSGKNYKAEEWLIKKLNDEGITNIIRFPGTNPYNLLVNDVKVRVVSSHTPKKLEGTGNVSPSWRFSLRKDREITDVFAFIIYSLEKVFFVPNNDIPRNRNELVFSYPTEYRNSGKWQSYENNFAIFKN